MTDTIFALATAAGRAAVAVVRVSGPRSGETLEQLAAPLPDPRHAALRRLKSAAGEVLDEALVLWLPGPKSFTGEDSAELHLHGGRAGVEAVTAALSHMGLRLAEPGEFSRRAFQNGKLDLTQAEAIADLVDAETDAQRRQALGQLEGGLSARYEAWRRRLIGALARLEAAVDFPDEDLPEHLQVEAGGRIGDLASDLEAALEDEGRGERVREGFRVAQVQQKRADRADERIAELRRQLLAAQREVAQVREDADFVEQQRAAAVRRADLAEEGWQVEAHLRRKHEAQPLWRIAARRLRAFAEGVCR